MPVRAGREAQLGPYEGGQFGVQAEDDERQDVQRTLSLRLSHSGQLDDGLAPSGRDRPSEAAGVDESDLDERGAEAL